PRRFFFQAEDGIRDYKVTGVQTCALPIFTRSIFCLIPTTALFVSLTALLRSLTAAVAAILSAQARATFTMTGLRLVKTTSALGRSEERRVGKESRSGWSR